MDMRPEIAVITSEYGDIIFGKADYETALDRAGYGSYSYKILISCCLCTLHCGIENCLSAYILPQARCDFNMTTYQMGIVNVGFMSGGIVSALVWGILTDITGRRMTLLINVFLDVVVAFAVVFSNSFLTLLILRTLNGFFTGAPSIIAFAYLGDLVGFRKRRIFLCLAGLCLTLSYLLLPALAWLMIPSGSIGRFSAWRVFQGLLIIPGFLATITLFYVPESPRLLLSLGQPEGALNILRKLYSKNSGKLDTQYEVKQLLKYDLFDIQVQSQEINGNKKSALYLLKLKLFAAAKQMNLLFHGELLPNTLLGMFVNFANMFGGFGLGLWIPELLTRLRHHIDLNPDMRLTVCESQNWNYDKIQKKNTSNVSENGFNSHFANLTIMNIGGSVLTSGEMNAKVYEDTILVGLTCFLFNAACTILSPKMNVRAVPLLTAILSALSAMLLFWANREGTFLAASCIFLGASITGNNVIVHMIMYLFPKNVSPMALSMCTLAGRLGAILCNLNMGILLDFACAIPVIAVVVISAVGAFCIAFMKNCDKQRTTIAPNNNFDVRKNIPVIAAATQDRPKVDFAQADNPFAISYF